MNIDASFLREDSFVFCEPKMLRVLSANPDAPRTQAPSWTGWEDHGMIIGALDTLRPKWMVCFHGRSHEN